MTTNFLWNPGTSNNGLIASAFDLMTTELNSLTNGSYATSSGSFSNSAPAQAIWAQLFLTLAAVTSTNSGSNVCGWFARSWDGTNFEQTAQAPARPPDFIFPVFIGAVTGGSVWGSSGLIMLPALKFKVVVQNNLGATLGASANVIKAAPVNMQAV
jgi:hypothetical protein